MTVICEGVVVSKKSRTQVSLQIATIRRRSDSVHSGVVDWAIGWVRLDTGGVFAVDMFGLTLYELNSG